MKTCMHAMRTDCTQRNQWLTSTKLGSEPTPVFARKMLIKEFIENDIRIQSQFNHVIVIALRVLPLTEGLFLDVRDQP